MKKTKQTEDWEKRITMANPPYEIKIDGEIVDDIELKDFIRSLLKEQKTEEFCSKCRGSGWIKVSDNYHFLCDCRRKYYKEICETTD